MLGLWQELYPSFVTAAVPSLLPGERMITYSPEHCLKASNFGIGSVSGHRDLSV